jgi:oxygen-independent coproporphyrinogen-3 oxidase
MRIEALGHGVVTDETLSHVEIADEFSDDGLRLGRRHRPARYEQIAGAPIDERRIAILREEGAVEVTPEGRLRVTQSGFPVLDAVVADLAA